jgi:hypothetical protein
MHTLLQSPLTSGSSQSKSVEVTPLQGLRISLSAPKPKPKQKIIKNKLSKELILHHLNYNAETGTFTWKIPTSNRARRNSPFGSKMCIGYIGGKLLGVHLLVHHLVWIVETGQPPTRLDHIDGDPTNNHFSNLREVSQRENTRNQKMHNHNTSGHNGVGYITATGKYRAYIGRRATHLGTFDTLEEAIEARAKAEASLGYSSTHGKRT